MNTRTLFSALLLCGVASMASATMSVDVPRPVKVTAPTQISRALENATVHVELTITEQGRASDVRVMRPLDAGTAAKIVAAVEQWEFTAPQKNGRPASMRVTMPIKLVDRL